MGEGSEVINPEKINEDTILYACKVPTFLEEVGNPSDESSLESDNYDIESKNYC